MDPSDHDILIELRSDVKSLAVDVKEMKDDTKETLADHETRLRFIEHYVWGAIAVMAAAELYLNIHL